MSIKVKVNEQIYLKDPESSPLGQKIFASSILLIDQIGFENITFRKLAEAIPTTEASVYRYFENKHKLLIYLVSWYWNWLEYQLIMGMQNIEDPCDRLERAIEIIVSPYKWTLGLIPVDGASLHRIVINEAPKAYLTKEVDKDNKEGFFLSYKRLCKRLAAIVREIEPEYDYPSALISTVVEAAHHQKFFSEHLPSLTEVSNGKEEEVTAYLKNLVFRTLAIRS